MHTIVWGLVSLTSQLFSNLAQCCGQLGTSSVLVYSVPT